MHRLAGLSPSALWGGLVHSLSALARPQGLKQPAASDLQGKVNIFASRRDRAVIERTERSKHEL